ncbi:MAG: TonB-dependent receptor [Candidatus Marinimicrobia bacterium]|nr:TonB-dependent receptor [Candidatus Neomarinimicrobiota bacterium]
MYHWKVFKKVYLLLFFISIFSGILQAQTGKIRGKVIEDATGEPLQGVNVVVRKASLGAATDASGNFVIVNVPPGKYSIVFSMIGYQKYILKNVEVSVNRTTNVNAELKQGTIEGKTVVVQAKKISVKKDQTSTVKNIDSDQISSLPIENVNEVVSMQAGVVQGHFRGGRATEVNYMIDGMSVNESYGGESQTAQVDPDAVQDIEVITGVFNAEYGRAMSGMVNIIPKEGSNEFHGKVAGLLSNYYTSHDIFIGLDNAEVNRNQDYKFMLGGPIWKDKLTFFTNIRYRNNEGYLNGLRRFNVDDYTDFNREFIVTGEHPNTPWAVTKRDFLEQKYSKDEIDTTINDLNTPYYYSEHTGDSAYVPMEWDKSTNILARLTFKPTSRTKVNLTYIDNNHQWQDYNNYYKFRPDGRATNFSRSRTSYIQWNQMITNKLFYNIKVGYNEENYEEYLYEDPLDDRYINFNYTGRQGTGFATGGQATGYYQRVTGKLNVNGSINWQINQQHGIETGFDYIQHRLKINPVYVRNKYANKDAFQNKVWYNEEQQEVYFKNEDLFELELLPEESISIDRYTKRPYEFAYYIQDKMEFQDMVINAGVRMDYFNPNSQYPSDWRNPANQLNRPDSTTYSYADPTIQISPRFGLSYSLGSEATIHFAYGHFFQIPQFYALYSNSDFMIPANDYATTLGNPNIEPEQTVKYEMGLQQQLIPGMIVNISVFYKDVYNLLTTKVVTTYDAIKYGLYSNKDYGNTKGVELKMDYVSGNYSIGLNYTLMYTRGNASAPATTFNRLAQNMDPVPKLIPMPWDQRHTLNLSLGYQTESYGMSLLGYYNSGLRYTWTPYGESRLATVKLYPNNSKAPYSTTFNFRSYYLAKLTDKISIKFNLTVYNLFDRKNIGVNESGVPLVNSTTGQPNTAIIEESDIEKYRSNFTTIHDTYTSPAVYEAPRRIKLGAEIRF